ncbi:MAG: albusnodin/ikarugamycin family macrolactam cyclase [Actinomycetota bacterium]|nr:albusnodin/ikarugamycin family macrolactam cyclase [Actinomycetota bacterium]
MITDGIHPPGFVGSFPSDAAAVPEIPDVARMWPDLPLVHAWGRWRPGEMHRVKIPGARLIVVGQCGASRARMSADLAAAVRGTAVHPMVTRWPGSYLAVVITPHAVTAFVDLAGQYPLYYGVRGDDVVFGTSPIDTAVAAGAGLRPDASAIAALLFCSSVPALTLGRTPLSGLHRLEAGEAMRVGSTGEITRWVYEAPAPRDDRDAADALRESLAAAVAMRMAGDAHVSADFSGGLDSTAIAFLAAGHRSDPLPAFVYHHPDAPAGDIEHATRNSRLSERIDLRMTSGNTETLAYQGLAGAPPTGLPDHAAAAQERTRLRLRHIAEAGHGIHLGGEGADALLVAPPAYLGDLARAGQVRRLIAQCRTTARPRDESPARVLGHAMRLSTMSMADALRGFGNALRRGEARHPTWIDAISWWPGPGLESAWLTTAARATLVRLAHDAAGTARASHEPGIADFVARHEMRASAATQQQLGEMARPYGVWPQAPFLDNDVIRACTSIPAHRRADGRTVKPLLRAALREVVPSAVLDRPTKGNYQGEEYQGARLGAVAMRKRFAQSTLADLGLIEPRAVIRSFDRAVLGVEAPFPALNRLIAFDLWLESLG